MSLDDLLKLFDKAERMCEARAARAAPDANKTTLIMAPGVPRTYRHWISGRNGRGEDVWFCVSDFCNVAGYFLVWRETRKPGALMHQARRSQWLSSWRNGSTVRFPPTGPNIAHNGSGATRPSRSLNC